MKKRQQEPMQGEDVDKTLICYDMIINFSSIGDNWIVICRYPLLIEEEIA